jgi:ankyrin repeat protein
MEALRNGDRKAFEALASNDPKVGNLKGRGGITPLMQAVLYGDAESVRFLLDNGADPNIRNNVGATALMWAVGDHEKTRLLIDHGADVNARSDEGRTPLLIAAGRLGSSATVKLLLDRGANVSDKSPAPQGGMTPVAEASRCDDDVVLRMLVERGADVNSAGFKPLVFAMKGKCAGCVELLLKTADRQLMTKAALMTPRLGDVRAVKTLVERGADPNARDPEGNTLLMLAASTDVLPIETIKALIDRGAEVNAKRGDGRTALDLASQRGSTAIVDLLLKAGAKAGTESARPVLVPAPKPATSTREAVLRSLPLLQKADSIFLRKSGCVSCHNNSLTAMTITTARRNGFPVDEQIAREQRTRIGAYLENWRERALQGVGIPGESGTIGVILFGLAADNYPPDAATDVFAHYVKSQQLSDGRWQNLSHRPPIESDDIALTAFSLKVLQVYAPATERANSVSRASGWLREAQPHTTQQRALRLLGLGWAGMIANDEIIKKAVSDLIAQQRADGGWAQLPTLASDAYATGQALVALSEAGAISVTHPAFKRGIEFLIRTQCEDGSWYVKSRAMPIQPFFEAGFPYGHDQWISIAATNWAATALALAAGK